MNFLKTLISTLAMAFILTISNANAGEDWDKTDIGLFTSFTIFNVADVLQTRYIFESDDFVEANPILKPLGKNGATAAMLGTNVALYFLLDRLPSKHRKWVLVPMNALKIGVVGRNYSLGVKFDF